MVMLPGEPAAALEALMAGFVEAGFRIVEPDAEGFSAKGPGIKSTSQNALRGVSRVWVDMSGQQLRMDAELGGVHTLQQLLVLLPPLVVLGVFGPPWLLWETPPPPQLVWVLAVWMLVVAVLVPALRRWTVGELDRLLQRGRDRTTGWRK